MIQPIQQPQRPAKFIVEIILVENGKSRKIAAYDISAGIPLPDVGDEIGFSDDAKEKIKTERTVFKVIKRRFPIPLDQKFIPSVFLFVSPTMSEQDDQE